MKSNNSRQVAQNNKYNNTAITKIVSTDDGLVTNNLRCCSSYCDPWRRHTEVVKWSWNRKSLLCELNNIVISVGLSRNSRHYTIEFRRRARPACFHFFFFFFWLPKIDSSRTTTDVAARHTHSPGCSSFLVYYFKVFGMWAFTHFIFGFFDFYAH